MSLKYSSAPPAQVRDAQTGTPFVPYALRPGTALGSREYCLLSTAVMRSTERMENKRNSPIHRLSPLTRFDAAYAARPTGAAARPPARATPTREHSG